MPEKSVFSAEKRAVHEPAHYRDDVGRLAVPRLPLLRLERLSASLPMSRSSTNQQPAAHRPRSSFFFSKRLTHPEEQPALLAADAADVWPSRILSSCCCLESAIVLADFVRRPTLRRVHQRPPMLKVPRYSEHTYTVVRSESASCMESAALREPRCESHGCSPERHA